MDVDWGAGVAPFDEDTSFALELEIGSCLEEVCIDSSAMRFVGGESVWLLLIVDDDAGVFEAVLDDILILCFVFLL